MRTSLSLIPGELWSAKCTTQGEGLLHPRPGKGRVDLPGRGQFYGEEGTVVSNGLEALKERCGSLKWGFGCGAHSTDYGSQRDRSQVIITSWIHPFPATECGDGSQRSPSFRAPLRTSLAPQHCTSVSHDFFPCSKAKLPGRSVCDLGKLNWVRWGGGDLRGLPELTHLCWPEAIHSWCLFSCLPSCSQLPCPAHSILFMLPTQLASLGSQQGLWDHHKNLSLAPE